LVVDPAKQKHQPKSKELSTVGSRIQVRQCNDSELLGFFGEHGVAYDLIGDHLFIIRSRKRASAAGPGDWLVARPDGGVEVERGDYARRAQRAITTARNARRERSDVVQAAT
jgi:hypothetical protein